MTYWHFPSTEYLQGRRKKDKWHKYNYFWVTPNLLSFAHCHIWGCRIDETIITKVHRNTRCSGVKGHNRCTFIMSAEKTRKTVKTRVQWSIRKTWSLIIKRRKGFQKMTNYKKNSIMDFLQIRYFIFKYASNRGLLTVPPVPRKNLYLNKHVYRWGFKKWPEYYHSSLL